MAAGEACCSTLLRDDTELTNDEEEGDEGEVGKGDDWVCGGEIALSPLTFTRLSSTILGSCEDAECTESVSSGIAVGLVFWSCGGGGLGGTGARLLPRDARERLDVDTTDVRFVVGRCPSELLYSESPPLSKDDLWSEEFELFLESALPLRFSISTL